MKERTAKALRVDRCGYTQLPGPGVAGGRSHTGAVPPGCAGSAGPVGPDHLMVTDGASCYGRHGCVVVVGVLQRGWLSCSWAWYG